LVAIPGRGHRHPPPGYPGQRGSGTAALRRCSIWSWFEIIMYLATSYPGGVSQGGLCTLTTAG
jgi:hypothetical protein